MIVNTKAANVKHPLSEFLQGWRSSQTTSYQFHVSLFGKGITHIDKFDVILSPMPVHFLQGVYSLDLSHNAIVRLDNIRQFCNLRVLNVAHNYIQDGKQLLKLRKLKNLRQVLVKGNGFLKSGEGKLEAFKLLILVQCDIKIMNAHQ